MLGIGKTFSERGLEDRGLEDLFAGPWRLAIFSLARLASTGFFPGVLASTAPPIRPPLREGAKFIETGAGHSGTGAVTFFNTVNHGALTFFHPENHGA